MLRVVALICCLTSIAVADDYPPPPPPEEPIAPPSSVVPVAPPPPPMMMFDPSRGPKSEGTAVLLSLAATIGPSIGAGLAFDDDGRHHDALAWIVIGAALLGPSAGHWYAGKPVTAALAVRAGGIALGASALGTDDLDESILLLLAGSACVIGGAIYDVATASRSAREYNFAHATRMMPVVAPAVGADGTTQLRLGLTGSF